MPLVRAYYAKHPTGGSLHIVLDDNNVEDGHVEYCIKYAHEQGDEEGRLLGELLLRMSKTQRLRIAGSWWKKEQS